MAPRNFIELLQESEEKNLQKVIDAKLKSIDPDKEPNLSDSSKDAIDRVFKSPHQSKLGTPYMKLDDNDMFSDT